MFWNETGIQELAPNLPKGTKWAGTTPDDWHLPPPTPASLWEQPFCDLWSGMNAWIWTMNHLWNGSWIKVRHDGGLCFSRMDIYFVASLTNFANRTLCLSAGVTSSVAAYVFCTVIYHLPYHCLSLISIVSNSKSCSETMQCNMLSSWLKLTELLQELVSPKSHFTQCDNWSDVRWSIYS